MADTLLTSWQTRYHSAHTYDGLPRKILDDLVSPQLVLPPLPGRGVAKVLIVSGANDRFNISEPDVLRAEAHRRFLEPLETLKAAVRSSAIASDFLVLTMPCAILHESVLGALIRTMFTLLQHRYSVHLRKLNVKDYGIPQDRSIIVLLASPVCAEPKWAFKINSAGDRMADDAQSITIGDAIEDLSFKNPRKLEDGATAFVCKYTPNLHPQPFAIAARTASPAALVYNHRTGFPNQGSESITMTSIASSLNLTANAHPAHPGQLSLNEITDDMAC